MKFHLLGVVAFSYRFEDPVVLNAGAAPYVKFIWSIALVAVERLGEIWFFLYFLHMIINNTDTTLRIN